MSDEAVNLLRSTARELNANSDPMSDRTRLHALAMQIAGLGRARAVTVIRTFLADGTDAPTRLGFMLGNDGLLTGAPTLRAFLLDFLERLDLAAAAEQAKTILTTPTSADEWAIALRSLARGRPEERDLIAAKLRQLLHHDAWRTAPSTGWLEAFDVAVHIGGTEFVPDLSALMQPENGGAVNHAAFLALDRLAARQPASVLPELLDASAGLPEREASRAGMLARADIRVPTQRSLVESYLLAPDRSTVELDTFSGVYPNANAFVSANLLTTLPATSHEDIIAHDIAALAVVEGWLADPRFSHVRPHLERMRSRLAGFVRQARL